MSASDSVDRAALEVQEIKGEIEKTITALAKASASASRARESLAEAKKLTSDTTAQAIPAELYKIRDVSGATGIRKFFLDGLLALEADARELVEWQDRGGVPHRRDFLPLEAAAIGAEYLDAKYSDVLAASWVSYLNRIIDHVTQNDVLYPYARGLPDRTIRYSLQIRGAGMTPVVQLIINELRDVAFNDQAALKTLYEEWQKGRAQ